MTATMNDVTTAAADEAGVTIRRLGGADADAVRRLAERDTARMPTGPMLGAEVDGLLLAAISTATGELIADPFHPTGRIVEMLKLRAAQVDGRRRGRGLLAWLLARPPSGASSAPSPPGAGGRLLTLSHRPEC